MNMNGAQSSDPRTDVSHQVSVDPVDDAGIDISHLEQGWNLWVSGTAIDPKVPTLFQVADVDTGVINWINADLVTHICPRV